MPGVFKQIEFRTFNVNNESSQLPCAFASGKYIWVLNLALISTLQFVRLTEFILQCPLYSFIISMVNGWSSLISNDKLNDFLL